MQTYQGKKLPYHSNLMVTVPGSKSITNRALLLAALAEGRSILDGVLFSDDSNVFLQALRDLGFTVEVDEKALRVALQGMGGRVPRSNANIYVGSAGTAARFLTAMTAMTVGKFRLDASAQMKKRPMKELFDALTELGAGVHYLCDEGTFPVYVTGIGHRQERGELSLNIDRSSQFLSALLMTAPSHFDDMTIHLTGQRSALSYVRMTEQMMKQFGHRGVEKLENDSYRVRGGDYIARDYDIEPDVSAACYFYALAAATGKWAMVKRMRKESLQGDMKFIKLLEKMGCTVSWERDGRQNLWLKGPDGKLKGMEVKMSDFSDQALTLAAIAPFADSEVTITGIAHIRGQESDRIKVIVDELAKMGILCNELPDGVKIHPGTPKNTNIETYNDHRVAMSFAVTGLAGDGMTILNPMCCKKTFAGFFDEIDRLEE